MDLVIRAATANDAAVIRQHILDLAIYEKAEDQVLITEAEIVRDGFGERPYFEVLLAEWQHQAAGFALFFHNYSTWQGRPGLYLEDLFVKPKFRGRGIGSALLKAVAQVAAERQCGRYQWACLDWNEPSIRFYESLGAEATREWIPFRVEGHAAIQKLAQNSDAEPSPAKDSSTKEDS